MKQDVSHPFIGSSSFLSVVTVFLLLLALGLLSASQSTGGEPLPPEVVEQMKKLGKDIADYEQQKETLEKELRENKDAKTGNKLSRDEFKQKETELDNVKQKLKSAEQNRQFIWEDARKVAEDAYKARKAQYALPDQIRQLRAKGDAASLQQAEALEAQLRGLNQFFGPIASLPTTTAPGAAALAVIDECKKQVMLSSVSPAPPVVAGTGRLSLINAPFAVRPAANSLLHLVQRGGGKTQVDGSNLPPDMGGPRGTRIEGKVPDTMVQGKSRSRGPGTLEVFDKNGKSHFLHVDKDGKYSGWVDDPDFKPVRAELQTGPDMQHIARTYYSLRDGRFVEVSPEMQAAVQAIMLHMMGLKGHTHLTNTADATRQGRKTVKLDTFQASVDYRHKNETPEHLAAGFLNWGQVSSGAPAFFSGDVDRGDFNLSIPTQADFTALDPEFKIGDWSLNLMVGVDYFQGCRQIPLSALSTGGDLNLDEVAVNNNAMFNSVLDGGVDYWAFKGTMEQQGFTFDNWTPLHLGRQTVLAWEIDERTYQDFRGFAGNQVISGKSDVGINIAPAPSLDPAYWPQRPARAIPRWTIDRRFYREED